ncbi:MAG: AMP-binding protein [Chloroflexi bacterium]|nr:AMP-binding protein [Chloroflexota bacterium]
MASPQRASVAPFEKYPLQEILKRTAARVPEKVAIIDGEKSYTYRQLDEYSDRFSAALARLGIAKGDRVGIFAPNCVEFEIAFYGIIKAGAVATTINSAYREREVAHQINGAGAEVMVVHEELLPVAEAARDATPRLKRLIAINATSADPDSFWGMMENAPPAPPSVAIDPDIDLAALPYSSGTTGLNKGVMLTHFNLTSNLDQLLGLKEEFVFRSDDVVLVHLPLFHIYGLHVLMNPTISVGGTQVMMGRFDMEEFLGLISRHRVTRLFTVPPVGLGLTQYPGVDKYDLTSLKTGIFGAAPLSSDLQQRIETSLGCPIIQAYGMTETSPYANSDFVEPELRKYGSVGPAAPDTEEKVVDLETGSKELPPGEIGELMIRGPQVMKGYFENPEATAETLTDDGWIRTGDIVRMNEEGYVWILDRKKELIKYKGFQVPPAELEGLLLEHPAVADAAVIGIPDVESGEVPKAFVVKKQGEEPSAAEIMDFVAEKVATFKRIKVVEFIDAIPKNPSGKILRRVLVEREREASGG